MEQLVSVKIVTKEIHLENNALPEGEFQINPSFTRTVGYLDDDNAFTELTVEINNTDEKPFPINLKVVMDGVFNLNSIKNEDRDYFLRVTAVTIIFPYLRSMISSITTSSFFPPIVFPVIDVLKLFPEE